MASRQVARNLLRQRTPRLLNAQNTRWISQNIPAQAAVAPYIPPPVPLCLVGFVTHPVVVHHGQFPRRPSTRKPQSQQRLLTSRLCDRARSLTIRTFLMRKSLILRFIGLSGGQIFHEMMLRHNVKHICMVLYTNSADGCSWIPWRCYSAGFRCYLPIAPFRLYSPSPRTRGWSYGPGLCSR
jgi:hypothetical protein